MRKQKNMVRTVGGRWEEVRNMFLWYCSIATGSDEQKDGSMVNSYGFVRKKFLSVSICQRILPMFSVTRIRFGKNRIGMTEWESGMMMKSICHVIFAFCFIENVVLAKPQTPDYSNSGNMERGIPESLESYLNVSVLDRMQQDAQTCKKNETVVVKFLQRPLNIDIKGMGQKMTGGVAAHVQIVAYHKETGKMIENFGVTGNPIITKKVKLLSETPLVIYKKYDQNPLGEVEMSTECYERVRDKTKKQLTDSYYSILNNVNLFGSTDSTDSTVKFLPDIRPPNLSSAVSSAGRILGEKVSTAVAEYDRMGRHNYKIVDDKVQHMSFPGLNCQSAVDIFLKNGEGEPTWKVLKPYRQPGEKGATEDVDVGLPKVGSKQEDSQKIMTEVRKSDDIPQPKARKTITMDDVLNALREDGSGAKKVSEALR